MKLQKFSKIIFYLLIMVALTSFGTVKINAEEIEIKAPFGWQCHFQDNNTKLLNCYRNSTSQISDLKYMVGTTYCSAGQQLCFEYDTGLTWLWLESDYPYGPSDSDVYNPNISENENLTFFDATSEYYLYNPAYYEENWDELKYSSDNKYIGIWYLTKDTTVQSCNLVDGHIGYYDKTEKKCYYYVHVLEATDGSCPSVGGVVGKTKQFLNGEYCFYTIYGFEESDCSNSDKYGTTGKYLEGYGQCIATPIGENNNIGEYDDKFYCIKGTEKREATKINLGSTERYDYYYFCKIDEEISGDYQNTSLCFSYKFLNESEVITKFGDANAGHHALNCSYKYVEQSPPTTSDPGYSGGEPVYKCKVIPNEIREWIQDGLNLVKYIALVIVVVLGILDFLKAAGSGEAEAMKKAGTDFLKRIIAVVILFLLPVIVDMILNLIEIAGVDQNNPLCKPD